MLFGKKKEERKPPVCACQSECLTAETDRSDERITSVKVLGPGCKRCHELFENAQQAVKGRGLSVAVEYITDLQKIMEYGVMSTPALVLNEKVVSMGKVLNVTEIEKML